MDNIIEEEKEKKLAEKDWGLRLEKEARKQLVNEVLWTRKFRIQKDGKKSKRTGRMCYGIGSHK